MAVAFMGLLVSGCPGNGNGEEEPLLELGEPCESRSECASGLCLTSLAEQVCGQTCVDEDSCPEGESCQIIEVDVPGQSGADGPDAGAPEQEVVVACVPTLDALGLFGDACESDVDCRTGLCHEGTCNELCDDCDDDRSCEPASIERFDHSVDLSVCHWDFAAPDISLGPLSTGEDGTDEIFLEIPEGLASFTIIVRHGETDLSQWVGILSLTAPDGTVLMSGDDDVMDLNQGATFYPGATTVMVPSTDLPEAFPTAGTYRLRAGLFETDYVDFYPVEGEIEEVRVVFERAGEEGGLLDVNLFFSPATGITREDAGGSEFVRNMLDRVVSYYGPFGTFRFGRIRYREIPEDYDSIESGDQVRELCQSRAQPGPNRSSINIFLVSSISFTAGMSGGAPGPPGVVDAASSGIVIERQGNASQTGTVLAHELGHFISLHHTTRVSTIDGERHIVGADGITDTPRCEPGTQMSDCPDYRNLMFPFFPFDGLSLTPGQGWVAARYPLLYEINRPETCAVSDSTYDISFRGFGSGDTGVLDDRFSPSCGGDGAPDRVQLYRLESTGLESLEATVFSSEFAPVLSVLRGSCDGQQLFCVTADAEEELIVTIPAPEPGWYFFVVDGRDGGGGFFTLDVREVSPPE